MVDDFAREIGATTVDSFIPQGNSHMHTHNIAYIYIYLYKIILSCI